MTIEDLIERLKEIYDPKLNQSVYIKIGQTVIEEFKVSEQYYIHKSKNIEDTYEGESIVVIDLNVGL